MKIILASESPRRKELCSLMGLDYEVLPSRITEVVPPGAGPAETVRSLALQKAEDVFRSHPDCCVIGADTVVCVDDRILGKPRSEEQAAQYLRSISGRTHRVYTGVALLTPDGADVRHDETVVSVSPMTEEEIRWYISTGEPMDKAGAYGIQGPFCVFVDGIDGNYSNVIGLPVPLLYRMLKDAGVITEPGACHERDH